MKGDVIWRGFTGLDGVKLANYRSTVAVGLAPYLGKEDIDKDIGLVGSILKGVSTNTLPHVDRGRRRQFHHKELSHLTVRSKDSLWRWCEAGMPDSGVEYEEKNRLRLKVRRCVHRCARRAEHKRIGRHAMIMIAIVTDFWEGRSLVVVGSVLMVWS